MIEPHLEKTSKDSDHKVKSVVTQTSERATTIPPQSWRRDTSTKLHTSKAKGIPMMKRISSYKVDSGNRAIPVGFRQYVKSARASDNRLRVIFADSIVSRNFAPEATLADIAHQVRSLSRRWHRGPVMIDVTVSAPLTPTYSPRRIRGVAQ
jgi:hypothetical protein